MAAITDFLQTDQPFYVYDQAVIARQAEALLTGLSPFEFLYSLKTNPFPPVVAFILSRGFGADAASPAEVELALAAGASPADIFYSAPGKSRDDLRRARGRSTIIADSYHELELLNGLAAEGRERLAVGVRINPGFTMDGGPGVSGKFGIDEETLADRAGYLRGLKHLDVTGLHIHLRSQVLDDAALAGYYGRVFQVARRCRERLGWKLEFLNFGGGLGIPYSTAHDQPLNVPRLGAECRRLLDQHRSESHVRPLIETGRFLVGQAGSYCTPIVDIKESRGRKYLVVKNGLNGFLRPAAAALLEAGGRPRNPHFSAEPLFTASDAFDFELLGADRGGPAETVDIVGNLCTAADILAVGATLPRARIGDWIKVSKAGSYAYSLSPVLFSSHEPPGQFLVDERGEIVENDTG